MRQQRDRVAMIGSMIVRLGFVIALVLGLGILFGIWSRDQVLDVHMGAGLLVLLGVVIVAVRLLTKGRGAKGPLMGAVVLGVVGAAIGLNAAGNTLAGIVHMIIMLLTVGLAEMAAASANRRSR